MQSSEEGNLMKILSKYIGPWAIPNEKIPLNVVWDSTEEIKEIILVKPEDIELFEVFNANYTIINDSKIIFKDFESNGYLSIELICKEIDMLDKKYKIVLKFKNDDIIKKKLKFETRIFRPKLELINVIDELKIIEKNNDFNVSNPIKLQYEGHGKVYVTVDSSEDSELNIKIPENIKKIMESFQVDLELGLNELRPKYQEYQDFFNLLEDDENLSLNNIESKLEIYSDIFENDSDFTKDFMDIFLWATKKNYAEIEDFIVTPFIEYVKSTPIQNVQLINPIWCIDFSNEIKIINLEIKYNDLEGNEYEPIKISTKMVGDTNGIIELYKLFEWECI